MRYQRLHLDVIDKKPVFISPSFPFVCRNAPSVKPSVCRIYPFVERYKFGNGFTLIELIITLTIAGILIALAAPAMQTFIANQRLTTQANELIADINLARSEAIKRATNSGVCASSTGTSCSGSWDNGWIIFIDADNSRTWSSGDSVLRVHESLTGSVAMSSSATLVIFGASGLLDRGTGAGDYTLCNSQIGQSRIINITTTGRPSMTSGTC
ncbi:MAG: prepilin-type N-terminal cleavage/methylation domain-containing protein [Gammaproteobacteria bacterium]|nr:MAG: prepilin-type N-terminal cleavage/methylation domain-containing protein [Gammaproteobacteria bacterium]